MFSTLQSNSGKFWLNPVNTRIWVTLFQIFWPDPEFQHTNSSSFIREPKVLFDIFPYYLNLISNSTQTVPIWISQAYSNWCGWGWSWQICSALQSRVMSIELWHRKMNVSGPDQYWPNQTIYNFLPASQQKQVLGVRGRGRKQSKM